MQQNGIDSFPPEMDAVPKALLKSLVDHYVKTRRPDRTEGRAYFHDQRDLESTIRLAAGCIRPDGKRFDHQRRLSKVTLEDATKRLLARMAALQKSQTFEELMKEIDLALDGLSGAGELYHYDVALRVAAKLDLRPEHVYLHAGTAKGASAFGFRRRDRKVRPSEFPSPFGSMPADELEDLLCIYKADLAAGKRLDDVASNGCNGPATRRRGKSHHCSSPRFLKSGIGGDQ